MKNFIFIMSLFLIFNCSQSEENNKNLNSLVESERAFAKCSIEKGLKKAFLTFLSEEAIVFRPGPVNGIEVYQNVKKNDGELSWYPVYADVSKAGDMGYTTGPYKFRKNSVDSTQINHGQYVSVWKKQNNDDWKVVLDIGISHNHPTATKKAINLDNFIIPEKYHGKQVNVELEKKMLFKLDFALSNATSQKSIADAYEHHSAADIRYYTPNHFPLSGKLAVHKFLSDKNGVMKSKTVGADISLSGDLCYTYGFYEIIDEEEESRITEKSVYVRIWRRNPKGSWELGLEILNKISN